MDNRIDVNQAITERQTSIRRDARAARANLASTSEPEPPTRRNGWRIRSGRQLIRLGERLSGERRTPASGYKPASAR